MIMILFMKELRVKEEKKIKINIERNKIKKKSSDCDRASLNLSSVKKKVNVGDIFMNIFNELFFNLVNLKLHNCEP